MSTIALRDGQQFTVADDKRLVLALVDNGIDILHRCGGYARCTTCRVVFVDGEPDNMTEAERTKLADQGDLGNFRLSCQILCDHDMTVDPLMRLSTTDMDDPGKRPEDSMTPEPHWTKLSDQGEIGRRNDV